MYCVHHKYMNWSIEQAKYEMIDSTHKVGIRTVCMLIYDVYGSFKLALEWQGFENIVCQLN